MWYKMKSFFKEWKESYERQQNLETAYEYCISYDKGKIDKETFETLIDSLDRGKE